MIKVENIKTYGWEAAIRGMRNPMNSWAKSDTRYGYETYIGENDLDLMQRLYKAGTEHRKYLRMITVTMDITAPLYWWKEYDTYKVGTVANSCSTMHKIHDKEFTLDDFSYEQLDDVSMEVLVHTVNHLNEMRNRYLRAKNNGADGFILKHYWWQMIQLLPSSYNQRRTVQFTYENVMAMIKQRENHKLDEWREFVDIVKDLPYVREVLQHD